MKVVEIILRDRMSERAAQLGKRLKDGLEALQQRYDCIGDVRGRGLLLGLDLVKDRRAKTPDPDLALKVSRACLELGMMTSVVRGGLGVFRIAPPLIVRNCRYYWRWEPDARLRADIGVRPETPIIVWFGGIYPQQGVETLIDVMPLLRPS